MHSVASRVRLAVAVVCVLLALVVGPAQSGFTGPQSPPVDYSVMNNVALRAAVYPQAPFITYDPYSTSSSGQSGGAFSGLLVDLMNDVLDVLRRRGVTNVSIVYDRNLTFDSLGSCGPRPDVNCTWSGLIGALTSTPARADIGVAFLTPSVQRMSSPGTMSSLLSQQGTRIGVDFTLPYLQSRSGMLVLAGQQGTDIWAFVRPFTGGLWLLFLMSSVAVALVAWVFDHYSPYGLYRTETDHEQRSQYNLAGSFLNTLMVLVAQDGNAVRSWSTRIMMLGYFFVCMILTATYTANLTAQTTVVSQDPSINSLFDVVAAGRPFCVVNTSATTSFLRGVQEGDTTTTSLSTQSTTASTTPPVSDGDDGGRSRRLQQESNPVLESNNNNSDSDSNDGESNDNNDERGNVSSWKSWFLSDPQTTKRSLFAHADSNSFTVKAAPHTKKKSTSRRQLKSLSSSSSSSSSSFTTLAAASSTSVADLDTANEILTDARAALLPLMLPVSNIAECIALLRNGSVSAVLHTYEVLDYLGRQPPCTLTLGADSFRWTGAAFPLRKSSPYAAALSAAIAALIDDGSVEALYSEYYNQQTACTDANSGGLTLGDGQQDVRGLGGVFAVLAMFVLCGGLLLGVEHAIYPTRHSTTRFWRNMNRFFGYRYVNAEKQRLWEERRQVELQRAAEVKAERVLRELERARRSSTARSMLNPFSKTSSLANMRITGGANTAADGVVVGGGGGGVPVGVNSGNESFRIADIAPSKTGGGPPGNGMGV